ncbi:MAG TPA: hypothetical protein VEQ85_16570, partial [Lacipirellulaceae bacterium]|nr:hypothetical protein [Lacipirellulaceae bacterium]
STAPVAPNSPVVAAAPAARTPNTRRTIGGLRAAAAQMEVAANRLEELELYRHADALRQQAQRMRVDARRIGAAASPRGSADQGPGADWQDPPESGYRRPPRGQGAASPSSFGPAEGDPPPAANWPMESGGSNGSDFRNRSADDERSVLIDPRAE